MDERHQLNLAAEVTVIGLLLDMLTTEHLLRFNLPAGAFLHLEEWSS